MAHQAPVNRMKEFYTESSADAPSQEALRGARRIAASMLELGELQARLLLTDAKAASRRLVWFAVLLSIGAVVLLGAMPVALHALGLYFAAQFEWSLAAGLALAGGSAAIVGAISLGLAYAVLRAGIAKFDRSASELHQNLAMLKSLVSGSPEDSK